MKIIEKLKNNWFALGVIAMTTGFLFLVGLGYLIAYFKGTL